MTDYKFESGKPFVEQCPNCAKAERKGAEKMRTKVIYELINRAAGFRQDFLKAIDGTDVGAASAAVALDAAVAHELLAREVQALPGDEEKER